MVAVWLDASLLRDARLGAAILAALRAHGADVVEKADGQPGFVAFDVADAEAYAAVAERSRAGTDRVLALPVGDADVWPLLAAGAADVMTWDPGTAADVVARLARWVEVDAVVDGPLVRRHLVGSGPRWRAVVRRLVEVAHFTSAPVLLTGESGTGKELAARLVHALDPRPGRTDLVVLDCTTVTPSLSGSEFFGHERGAFTGAVAARDGAFAAANGGTLFLDEVGELPMPMQAELLRVVQEGTYKRVGGNVWHRTAFRLVCATHRDLAAEHVAGTFRPDLYYRIAGSTVHLPPLRERRADVVPLFRHFLAELSGGVAPPLHPAVESLVADRAYPGNGRDLRQLAARVHARHVGTGPVTPGDVPREDWPTGAVPSPERFGDAVREALASGMTYADIRDTAADLALGIALEEAGGNAQRAAARLGVTDRTVQKYVAGRRSTAGAADATGE